MSCADAGPEMTVAVVSGDEAEDYVRVLAAAPMMLASLAKLLRRWERAAEEGAEIDGGDAVEWLAEFAPAEGKALRGAFDLWPPERML